MRHLTKAEMLQKIEDLENEIKRLKKELELSDQIANQYLHSARGDSYFANQTS